MGAVSSGNGMSEIYHSSPNLPSSQTHPAEQLSLFAPQIVREHGLTEFHAAPFVSHGRRADGSWAGTYRVSPEAAWEYPEIELRTPNSCPVLLFDCDQGSANPIAAALAEVLPWPNWICRRGESGGCHAAYCLQRAVLTRPEDLSTPQQALTRITEFYTQELRADPRYTGVLTHNPVHEQWETEWGYKWGYGLDELSQFLPPGYRMPCLDKIQSSQGRNSGLFKAGMKWCGLPRNWTNLGAVYPYLTALNGGLAIPLPLREVEGIAKSVVNISSHNLASGQTQARFSQIQAARGRKGGRISGAKRHQGSNEEAEPWEEEGVSRKTWYRHKNQPHKSIKKTPGWEAAGVARATWYDRQAKPPRQSIKKQKPWEAEGISRADVVQAAKTGTWH